MKKIFLFMTVFFLILHSNLALASHTEDVEIFDPEKNMVIKLIPQTDEIKNMLRDWIEGLEEIYPAISPLENEGFTIKFPMDTEIEFNNKFINGSLEYVYLVIPRESPSFLILFSKENPTLCFAFPGNVDELSRILDFDLQ